MSFTTDENNHRTSYLKFECIIIKLYEIKIEPYISLYNV